MPRSTITLIPDTNNNSITINNRNVIMTMKEPITSIRNIVSVNENIVFNDNNPSYLDRFFRYSKDGKTWSMWYAWMPFEDDILNRISVIQFNPDDEIYFSFKYEYNELLSPEITNLNTNVTILSIGVVIFTESLRFPLRMDINDMKCLGDACPENLFDKKSSLDLYDVGNLSDFYTSMSSSVAELAGLPICYFATSPDESGTDYIFREYSLYNIIARKCIKGVIPDNDFGGMQFMYTGQQMNYANAETLTIHMDKAYFEANFGKRVEPRKKDFIYIPILNRVYEVKNAEMERGFMMIPVYWVLSLKKFSSNINLRKTDEQAKFLDNMILSSGDQFGNEMLAQTKNATMKKQISTKSAVSDETRFFLDQALNVRETEFNYNYTRLINYYYDMESVLNSSGLGVIYNGNDTIDETHDATFMFSIRMRDTSEDELNFVTTDGSEEKFKIYANYKKRTKSFTLNLDLNGENYNMTVDGVDYDKWYTIIVCILPQFSQIGLYMYDYTISEYDENNATGCNRMMHYLFDNCVNMNIKDKNRFALSKCNVDLANFRLFNQSIDEEKHEYVVSQLFIKDESLIRIIDNCRPKIGTPFIMKKY